MRKCVFWWRSPLTHGGLFEKNGFFLDFLKEVCTLTSRGLKVTSSARKTLCSEAQDRKNSN